MDKYGCNSFIQSYEYGSLPLTYSSVDEFQLKRYETGIGNLTVLEHGEKSEDIILVSWIKLSCVLNIKCFIISKHKPG